MLERSFGGSGYIRILVLKGPDQLRDGVRGGGADVLEGGRGIGPVGAVFLKQDLFHLRYDLFFIFLRQLSGRLEGLGPDQRVVGQQAPCSGGAAGQKEPRGAADKKRAAFHKVKDTINKRARGRPRARFLKPKLLSAQSKVMVLEGALSPACMALESISRTSRAPSPASSVIFSPGSLGMEAERTPILVTSSPRPPVCS